MTEESARLLGKSDGVIDGFDTLVEAVVRIVDLERQARSGADGAALNPIDEQALEQRIADELDRVSARDRAAGGDPPDRTES